MQLWSFFEKAVGQAGEATVTHPTACTALASGLFRPKGSKQLCQTRVIKDAQRRPISTGPMSVQPAEHQSIAPTQSQPMLPTTDKVPQPVRNKTSTRAEAIRVAKARIVRRNSLRKQRQLQKDYGVITPLEEVPSGGKR